MRHWKNIVTGAFAGGLRRKLDQEPKAPSATFTINRLSATARRSTSPWGSPDFTGGLLITAESTQRFDYKSGGNRSKRRLPPLHSTQRFNHAVMRCVSDVMSANRMDTRRDILFAAQPQFISEREVERLEKLDGHTSVYEDMTDSDLVYWHSFFATARVV